MTSAEVLADHDAVLRGMMAISLARLAVHLLDLGYTRAETNAALNAVLPDYNEWYVDAWWLMHRGIGEPRSEARTLH